MKSARARRRPAEPDDEPIQPASTAFSYLLYLCIGWCSQHRPPPSALPLAASHGRHDEVTARGDGEHRAKASARALCKGSAPITSTWAATRTPSSGSRPSAASASVRAHRNPIVLGQHARRQRSMIRPVPVHVTSRLGLPAPRAFRAPRAPRAALRADGQGRAAGLMRDFWMLWTYVDDYNENPYYMAQLQRKASGGKRPWTFFRLVGQYTVRAAPPPFPLPQLPLSPTARPRSGPAPGPLHQRPARAGPGRHAGGLVVRQGRAVAASG